MNQDKYILKYSPIYLCWSMSNRVVIGIIYFKDGAYYDSIFDYDTAKKVCRSLIKKIPISFVKFGTEWIKINGKEITEDYWNNKYQPYQNNLIQTEKTKAIHISETMDFSVEKFFNTIK